MKKRTKKSKKGVLQKMVLIYNKSKVHVNERKFGNDTTFCKCNCPFDMVALIKDNVWILQVQKAGYNHEFILSGIHLTYQKAIMTQDV